jgi:hypothetical protein
MTAKMDTAHLSQNLNMFIYTKVFPHFNVTNSTDQTPRSPTNVSSFMENATVLPYSSSHYTGFYPDQTATFYAMLGIYE